jgi:RNA polymerase primary sigma factor
MEALAVKSRIVRVPLNQVGIAGKVNRATEQFLQEHGRVPSIHELAQLIGIDEEQIDAAQGASGRTTSIDAPLGNEDDNSMADLLASDDNDYKSDSSLDKESLNQFINDSSSGVNPPNRKSTRVVRHRHHGRKVWKRLPTRWS